MDDVTPRSVGELYAFHFRNRRRERIFLSSVGFLLTFGIVRGISHAIRAGIGPFQDLGGATHVHHLVWGILLLLGVGYLWLAEIGTDSGESWRWLSPLTVFYGVGAALTLDEFALWLNLQDVYWANQGRESIDAVVLFGSLLSVGFWGGSFVRGVAHESFHAFRRR